MTLIIVRKDQTSIACINRSASETARKLRNIELTIAAILIVVGTSLMFVLH